MKKIIDNQQIEALQIGDDLLLFEDGEFYVRKFEGFNEKEFFTSAPRTPSVIHVEKRRKVLNAPYTYGFYVDPKPKEALKIQIDFHKRKLKFHEENLKKCK